MLTTYLSGYLPAKKASNLDPVIILRGINMNAIEVTNLNKYFDKLHVLRNLNFEIKKNRLTSITGKSGSGKSTLLYLLSTMDTDFEGHY